MKYVLAWSFTLLVFCSGSCVSIGVQAEKEQGSQFVDMVVIAYPVLVGFELRRERR